LLPGGVVEGRHPSDQGRKPGPAPWGLPPPGPASVPPRGRASRALPHGKEASPEGEYRHLRGVEPRRKGEGQKGPRGRGLPAGGLGWWFQLGGSWAGQEAGATLGG